MLAANYAMKEYTLILTEENMKIFYDANKLRSIGVKSNCHIELTDRILNRKISEYKYNKYAIVRIEGQNEISIHLCNKLLERNFPFYHKRKEYLKSRERTRKNGTDSDESLGMENGNKTKCGLIEKSNLPTCINFKELFQWRLVNPEDIIFPDDHKSKIDPGYFLWNSFLEQQSFDPSNVTKLSFHNKELDQKINGSGDVKPKKYIKHNKYLINPPKQKEYVKNDALMITQRKLIKESFFLIRNGIIKELIINSSDEGFSEIIFVNIQRTEIHHEIILSNIIQTIIENALNISSKTELIYVHSEEYCGEMEMVNQERSSFSSMNENNLNSDSFSFYNKSLKYQKNVSDPNKYVTKFCCFQ